MYTPVIASVVKGHSEDGHAGYAAAVLDLVGEVIIQVSDNPGSQRVAVRAKIVSKHGEVLERLHLAYGGDLSKAANEAVVTVWLLSWPDMGDLHDFLSSVAPYSIRWGEVIRSALPYLELLSLFRQQEAELIDRLCTN